jgi:hypothetical protein
VRLLDRIEATKQLWTIVCPRIDPPADTWIARWCTEYPESIIEAGIIRTGQKFEYERLDDSTRAHRYATATFRNIEARIQEGEETNAQPTNY